MVLDKIECGKITVDKYFDVRYGSEKYFEYIGREAYRALPKLLYSDDIDRFMAFFGNVNEEWKGITLKLRRGDEIYRDAYIRMRKKHNLIGGEQLWDVEFYDIESLVRAYESSCENNNMYRILLGYAEHTYFRYEHDTGEIGVYNVKNGREHVLFAMKFDRAAVYYGPEYKLAYYYGAECSDTAFWADSPTYLEHFDNDGIHLASSFFKVEGAEREIFERFKMQHTECCIQVILGDKEHVYGYTSFECCNKGKRYEESLGNSINYISKLIYEVMRREG